MVVAPAGNDPCQSTRKRTWRQPNEVSEAGTRFFGLEIELWQIGESPPAPKFNVVAKPNDWTKERIEPTALTATLQMQLDFWKGFAEFVARKGKIVTRINSPTICSTPTGTTWKRSTSSATRWNGTTPLASNSGRYTGTFRQTLEIGTSVPTSTAGYSRGSKRSTASWHPG